MKRYISYFSFFLVFFVNISCEKGTSIKEENARLTNELTNLKQDNEVLRGKITTLEKQVMGLSETPAAMYEQAQRYKGLEQYDEAVRTLEKIVIKASDQPIAQKAQTEIAALKNLKAQKKAAEEKARKDAFKDIGGGFAVRRISGKSSIGMTEFIGEIKNNSGQTYNLVNISIALYDSEENLLGNAIANISNLSSGSVKSFSAYSDVPLDRIAKYRVQFENAI
jgi:cell division protein FtsB